MRKHTSGTINPSAIVETSAIRPIMTGMIAPPTIDITRNEDAFLVKRAQVFYSESKDCRNMTDIKKYVEKSATTDVHPNPATTRPIVMTFTVAYAASSLLGRTIRMKTVLPVNLPSQNNPIPPIPSISEACWFAQCWYLFSDIIYEKAVYPVCAAT